MPAEAFCVSTTHSNTQAKQPAVTLVGWDLNDIGLVILQSAVKSAAGWRSRVSEAQPALWPQVKFSFAFVRHILREQVSILLALRKVVWLVTIINQAWEAEGRCCLSAECCSTRRLAGLHLVSSPLHWIVSSTECFRIVSDKCTQRRRVTRRLARLLACFWSLTA